MCLISNVKQHLGERCSPRIQRLPSRRTPEVNTNAYVLFVVAVLTLEGTAKSSVLHPTSGPLAPLSSKKARKLEKAKNHARQRQIEKAMAAAGEIEMTGKYKFYPACISSTNEDTLDAPTVTKKKAEGEQMDVDIE